MFKSLVMLLTFTFYSNLFSQDLFPFIQDDLMGYIDTTGKVVIEPKFKPDIDEFTLNKGNKKIDGFIFNRTAYFNDGLAIAKKPIRFLFITFGYHYGYINKTGEFQFKFYNKILEPFTSGLAPIMLDERYLGAGYNYRYGYINPDKEIIIGPRFNYAGPFSEGLALVIRQNNFTYIDKSGNPVIKTQFDDASSFSEGFAAVKKNGKYGFINKNAILSFSLNSKKPGVSKMGALASSMENISVSSIHREKSLSNRNSMMHPISQKVLPAL